MYTYVYACTEGWRAGSVYLTFARPETVTHNRVKVAYRFHIDAYNIPTGDHNSTAHDQSSLRCEYDLNEYNNIIKSTNTTVYMLI